MQTAGRSEELRKMKRIKLEEIERKQRPESYAQLCSYIYGQIEDGSLKPVKASKTNGKKPALYYEYWMTKQDANGGLDYSLYEEELKYRMSTKVSVDYYLRHLEQYHKDREWVLMLNRFLLRIQQQETVMPVSKNERSFEIWNREKFLQLESGRKILKRCGIDASQLSYYETSEPLAYYSRHRRTPQNLLILENKDTFYSMRRHLLEHDEMIFETAFGTLIYGAGKGILRSFQDFSFCVEPYMKAQENQIYYFGDLDYEGIGIYERLAEPFECWQYEIRRSTAAYERMLAKAQKVCGLPMTKEKQNRRISGRFFAYFSEQTVLKMKEILESGRYIPQEILNIGDFGGK